ncbi:Midasin, partial [Bienertia sinuspersici]
DYFGTYLFMKGHSTADWVRQFKIRQIKFDWQSCRTNMDCGVFLLYHCCLYQGKAFKSANLHKASQRRIYRAEICASIVLSDLNIIRSQVLSSVDDFNKNRIAIQASVIQDEQEKIKKEKMEKELLEAEEKRAKKLEKELAEIDAYQAEEDEELNNKADACQAKEDEEEELNNEGDD